MSILSLESNKLKKVTYHPFLDARFEKAIPTTPSQREMLSSLAMDPKATLCYNESLVLSIEGKLKPEILNLAFQEILKRHDSLRMIFSGNGKYFYIQDYVTRPIQMLGTITEEEFENFKEEEVTKPFNLKDGPLFRVSLVTHAERKYSLIFTAHHIICDGWSFAVLLNELSTIYTAMDKNISFAFKPACQFADFALNSTFQEQYQRSKSYWTKEYAQSVPKTELPLDYSRAKFRSFESERVDVDFPGELVKRIKKFSTSQGCSLYTTLMGQFQLMLHKLTGVNEFVVGMASAAQSESGLNDLVGHLVNLLPLKCQVQSDDTYKSFLRRLRSKMLDAFEHQHLTFGHLLEELRIERDPSRIPLVNVVFNIDQQYPGQGLKFDGLNASYSTTPRKFENFELFVNVVSCEDRLTIECQYNSKLFDSKTIRNWFETYIKSFESTMARPESLIRELAWTDLVIPTRAVRSEVARTKRIIANPAICEHLRKIWQEVLGSQGITDKDNFFSLGGHSLLALELAEKIQKEYKVDFTIRQVFENPSIEEQAALLSLNPQQVTYSSTISKYPPQEFYPVTNNQLQIWFLEEMHKGTLMHNLPASIRLKCYIDHQCLEKALQLLMERHEAFRTSVITKNNIPVQKVYPKVEFRLPKEKISESALERALNQEAQYVFDTSQPPLCKAKLFQLDENDFVFFFMVHHAIWDGWSFDIFFKELDLIYSALVNNQQPDLSPGPSIAYGDYSLWLEETVSSGKLNHQLDFWKQKLQGPLPVLELPADFKRRIQASHDGGTIPFVFSQQEAEELRKYARSQGTSLFNVLLTAFKITLARYANLDDIIVGSPVRNRQTPELQDVIGYFVNTVALRTKLKLDASFEENLQIVVTTCLEAFDHQSIPFQLVLNNVPYCKDSSRTPIFQTFFSFQDVSNRDAKLNGVPYQQINVDKASTHTDMDLWIKANDHKIEGAFEYRKDLFKSETIKRFSACFHEIIHQLKHHKRIPVSQIDILPGEQKKLILEDWNQTESSSEAIRAFHLAFETQVQKSPHSIAVFNNNSSLTYSDLNRYANKVAHGLIKSGVQKGDLVGLSLTRDLPMMISLLGILKTGAGYVPLDPAFPQDRLDYMLESSCPRVLITEPSLDGRYAHVSSRLWVSDLMNDQNLSDANPEIAVDLKDTMYVIYTSGSTGKPKGVQISHGALGNFLISMSKKPGISERDKLLAVTTLSFDIAALELYLPLIKGASVYLASSLDVIDGKALREIIEKHHISMMQATPSSWRLLLSAGWPGKKEFRALCGGEPFPLDLAHKLVQVCGSVWNMYGPTETTVWSTVKEIRSDDLSVSIGYPIDNTYTYILDEHLNLAPIGTPGELYIGGLGLADGYFKRPDLTNERFVSNPFRPGEKMYATGDMARYLSNGEIECLGRQDGQVKVRGYRIELGEIEAVLNNFNFIKNNAVITKEVRPGDVRIIAFLVLRASETFDEKNLREALSIKLPKYMIPSHFHVVGELPQTLNGKIDKKSLGMQVPVEKNEIQTMAVVTAPSTLKEEIRTIWSQVLRCDVQDSDNFFDKGGNSLLAVQLFSRLSRQFNLSLPLSLLLESESLLDFVETVRKRSEGKASYNTTLVNSGLKSAVIIQHEGNSNPVFCFHGVGGNVLNYKSLVSSMNAKRPLIGMQSIGMGDENTHLDSIESMAVHYIQEMKMIQPQGPYFLAGGSMGGMIAFEVAQQLKRSGEKIEKLVMFDTFGPNINIKGYDEGERNFIQNLKISFFYKKKAFVNKVRLLFCKWLNLEIPLDIRLFNVEMNNYRALWKYVPTSYEGDLHIIRGKMKEKGWYSDPYMGWRQTIKGQISLYEIEGIHGSFIESPQLGKEFEKLI